MTLGQIQEYRHKAKDQAKEVYKALRVEAITVGDVSEDTGWFGPALKGVQGFTKDQQVERLTEAKERATALRAKVTDALPEDDDALVAKIKEALSAQREQAVGAADALEATLAEAAEVAATRDFDAYLARKRGYDTADSDEGEADDED